MSCKKYMKEFAETILGHGHQCTNSFGWDIIGLPCRRMPFLMSKCVTITRGLPISFGNQQKNSFTDGPMAFCIVGIRHHGSIPNSNSTAKVFGGWYRLLHKVGRSRSTSHHHEEKCARLRMEEHLLQVRYSQNVGLLQREAIRQQCIQRLLFIARD